MTQRMTSSTRPSSQIDRHYNSCYQVGVSSSCWKAADSRACVSSCFRDVADCSTSVRFRARCSPCPKVSLSRCCCCVCSWIFVYFVATSVSAVWWRLPRCGCFHVCFALADPTRRVLRRRRWNAALRRRMKLTIRRLPSRPSKSRRTAGLSPCFGSGHLLILCLLGSEDPPSRYWRPRLGLKGPTWDRPS